MRKSEGISCDRVEVGGLLQDSNGLQAKLRILSV